MSTAVETRLEEEGWTGRNFDGRLCDIKCYEHILRVEEAATTEDRE
jgi:hypothetical protein